MIRRIISLFIFMNIFCIGAFHLYSQEVKRYETQNDMPLFYQKMKERLTYPLSFDKSDKHFKEWKKDARVVLMECISPLPPKAASYDMKVVDEEQRKGYKAQKVEFNISDYSRTPAYILIPDGKGPFPAILLLHDHGAHFSIGKEKMIRPFNTDSLTIADADNWCDKCYDGQYVGDYLASKGYVVMSVDALFWGERGRKEGIRYDSQQALAANMLQLGMSWGGLIVGDDLSSADFLASLSYVDKKRVGCMGFSMGAHRSWMLSAASDVVKASASVCWMNTTDSLMTLTNNQNKGGSAYSMIIPGIRNYMDYPHVASIAAPKPTLFINGKRDKLFPVKGVEDAFVTMHKVWNSCGANDKLQTHILDIPHFCNKEVQKMILDFFDNNLK